MLSIVMAGLVAAGPSSATAISVACHVTGEQRFTTNPNGSVSSVQRNPLTIETFTIVDSGIRGFSQGDTTSDHANGIEDKDGTKRSVFIDRKTGSLMEVWEFAPIQGFTARWVENGTCQKTEAF